MNDDDIAARFKRDTADHVMTVLHEDGLYRHLRLMNPRSSEYWFEIVTWPGSLAMRGDVGDGFVFSRLDDMFQFFRADRPGINPHYWAEKLGGGRRSVKEYSEVLFRQLVVEHFVESVRWSDAPRGLGKAIRAEILNQDLTHEGDARDLLEGFEFKGFEFSDVWEWDFHDYEPEFIWACHAIVWAIGQYDAARQQSPAQASPTAALSAIRTAAQDSDMTRVRQLVTDYYADLRGAEDMAVTS